jgi:hypothetical protein
MRWQGRHGQVRRANDSRFGTPWQHRNNPTAAVPVSLVQSCKAEKADPFAYLPDLVHCVSTHPASRIGERSPDCWKPAEPTDPYRREGNPVTSLLPVGL